ncbi:BsuPI-related putative proteinase inhibitor [Ornithinibacillus salinisoli]|uniref:Intracellular proteinase inhibitor BsuPI domain-containing protein n=1 Tax=Ornithinibacillus salinisoli TaxID=1848459 RepID=A0ABW4W1C4_9BACI
MTKKILGFVFILLMVAIAVILLLLQVFTEGKDNNAEREEIEEQDEEGKQLFKRKKTGQKFNPEISTKDHSLDFSLTEIENYSEVKTFSYVVTNKGTKPEKILFPTSQRYEYEISGEGKGIIYRFSDGRAFMQVLKEIILSPDEELAFEITLPKLEQGEYKLDIFLTAKGIGNSRIIKRFTINE